MGSDFLKQLAQTAIVNGARSGPRRSTRAAGQKSPQCWVPNSPKIRYGAYSDAIGQWMFSAVLLEDMPHRMRRRVLRGVSRLEVDAVFAAESPLRALPGRVAKLGRRLMNLRATIPWISRHS